MAFIFTWLLVSYVFDLELTGALFDRFISVGAIALIVIFQEEIRGFFYRIGARFNVERFKERWSRAKHMHNSRAQMDAILNACAHMSASKTGALIVITGQQDLKVYEDSGEMIDAVLSTRLIENIFFKNTPLHDGAVIIRDCRIVSASNKSKTIAENSRRVEGLGTRHRAALKISEVSDAVVVIVSEETGTISVANNKLLKRNYNDIGKRGKHKSGDLRDDLFLLMTGKTVLDMMSPDGEQQDDDEQLKGLEEIKEGGDAKK
jgi:uncharacterized protein (TIGR00159 family)